MRFNTTTGIPECDELIKLLDFLNNKVSAINHGGCGIAAVAIYDCLKKHGYKADIVYAYSYKGENYELNKTGRKTLANAEACSHAMVKVNGIYIDSKGIRDIKEWEIKHIVSRKFVILSILNGDWNSFFDRSSELPKIKKKIGYDLLATNQI